MRFFLAPLVFAAGFLLMKYSVQVTDQFSGKIDLAEKYLGVGVGAGTYTFWKLFGLALCVLAVLWLFNKLPSSPPSPETFQGAAPSAVERAPSPSDATSMIIQMMI